MNDDHAALQELVLGYEHLEPAERLRADAHLAVCPSCRRTLEALQGVERRARLAGAFPDLPEWKDLPGSEDDLRSADRSLALLLQRLDDSSPEARSAPRPRPRWLRPVAWAVPLAAAAVLLLLVQPQRRATPPLRAIELVAPSSPRGGPAPGEGRRTWYTGERFVLRFTLEQPASPVVIHVDPAGAIELLYPERVDAPMAVLPASTELQLPPASTGASWAFEGDPGTEVFLVAAAPRGGIDLARVLARLEALPREPEGVSRVERMRGVLEEQVGPVQAIEVDHLP